MWGIQRILVSWTKRSWKASLDLLALPRRVSFFLTNSPIFPRVLGKDSDEWAIRR